jgi:DNA-binding NarL/FixJ family response regulator
VRILIADDNPLLRRALRSTIEAQVGWTICSEAADGREAVQQAKQCNPDLVILDFAMPHINGVTAAYRISELCPGVPILLFTLYASKLLEQTARDASVLRVIPKTDTATLLAAVKHACLQIQNRDPLHIRKPTTNSERQISVE